MKVAVCCGAGIVGEILEEQWKNRDQYSLKL
jgi:hypothetical protein